MTTIDELRVAISADIKQLDQSLKNIKGKIDTLDKSTDKMNRNSVKGFGSFALAVGIANNAISVGINLIRRFVGALSLSGIELQVLEKTFVHMYDTVSQGKKLLRDLKEYSLGSIFTYKEVVDAATKLRAFNIEAEDTIELVEALGNISTVVGSEALPRLTLALGQVKTMGRLQGQETRQFTESAVPIIKALSISLGKSTEEIQKLQSEGKIGFEDVKQALLGLSQGAGQFAGLLEKASDTVKGSWQRLAGTIEIISTKIVSGPIGKFAQKILDLNNQYLKTIFNIQTAGEKKLEIQNRLEEVGVLIDAQQRKLEALKNSSMGKITKYIEVSTGQSTLNKLLKERTELQYELNKAEEENKKLNKEDDYASQIKSNEELISKNQELLNDIKTKRKEIKKEISQVKKDVKEAQDALSQPLLSNKEIETLSENLVKANTKLNELTNSFDDFKTKEEDIIGTNKNLREEIKRLAEELAKLKEEEKKDVPEFFDQNLYDEHVKEFKKSKRSIKDLTDTINESTDSWSSQLADAILDSKNGFESLGEFAKSVFRDIARAATKKFVTDGFIKELFRWAVDTQGNDGGGTKVTTGGDVSASNVDSLPTSSPSLKTYSMPSYQASASDIPSYMQQGSTTNNNNNKQSTNIVQNFNISTGTEINAIDAKIAQAAPLIASDAKNGVLEAIARGQAASRAVGR